jgi:hypothetical protein
MEIREHLAVSVRLLLLDSFLHQYCLAFTEPTLIAFTNSDPFNFEHDATAILLEPEVTNS